jgi:transcriptional regulator with XRE-family HTH domain
MKQSELAAQIRVDRSLITQWFSGHQRVTQDQAVAVAGVLGEDLIDYFAADLKAEAQRRAAVLA